MKQKKILAGVVAATGLLTAVLTGTAHADTNTTSTTALAAVGSDTTMDVMEGLSGLSTLNTVIANYRAIPRGSSITTLPNAPAVAPTGVNCTVTRPAGSGDGRDALSASMRNAAYAGGSPAAGGTQVGSAQYGGCVGIARSSSGGNPTTSPGLNTMTYIPFATDALDVAVPKNNTLGKKYSFTFLKDVYTRNGVAGSAACLTATPLIPAFSSGTRGFWASALGITDWDFSGTGDAGVGTPPASGTVTWGSCVTGGAANTTGVGTGAGGGLPGDRIGGSAGTPIQEHNGSFLSQNTGQLLPFSSGQYIAQGGGVITDLRGSAVLASVDFTSTTNAPVTANLVHPWGTNGVGATTTGFSGATGNLTRAVYNVVPTTLIDASFTPPSGAAQANFVNLTDTQRAPFIAAFVGSTSAVCQATSTILLYGFAPRADCGAIVKRNTN